MKGHQLLSVVLAIIFILSIVLLSNSLISMNKASKKLEKILNISPENIQLLSRDPLPTIDDQILVAQSKLRTASNGIRSTKERINFHAIRAVRAINQSGEQSLRDAKNF